MTALYVASLAEGQGKTTLAAAIAKWLQSRNKKVGYFKPLRAGQALDKDAAFMKEALSLKETVEQLAPFALNDALAKPADLAKNVQAAYAAVSQDKDIVIVEGLSGLAANGAMGQANLKIIEALNAKVLLATYYGEGFASGLQNAAGPIKARVAGIVVNAVPTGKFSQVKAAVGTQMSNGIRILGVIPQQRSLASVSVSELAEYLKGKLLVPVKNSGGLIENLMMGALTPDPALLYYGHKDNKAVIVRADRTDMQIAALGTSVRCLVVTGGKQPIALMIAEAEDKGVPVISVEGDNLAVVAQIEALLKQARFQQKEKIDIAGQLLTKNFDFDTLNKGLGLKA